MRFLTIYRHWFECFGSTKHISTWQNICEQLGIDDDPENIDKIIVSVARCRYDVEQKHLSSYAHHLVREVIR